MLHKLYYMYGNDKLLYYNCHKLIFFFKESKDFQIF